MTEKQKFDTDAIIANTDLVELVSRYAELKPDGREYKALCVAHNDTDPSMHVVPDKNFVHCFACGFHENAIGFLMHMEQIDFVAACKKLTGDGGDNTLPEPKPIVKRELQKAPSRRTFAPPANTPAPDMELKGLGQPTHIWTYRTLTGEMLGYVTRYTDTDRKEIRCWSWGNRADHEPASWACGHFSEPRPLYGQEKLTDTDKQVLIVEGEKAADAATALFPKHVVISWPGGANAVKKADWSMLKGRKVVLIPDNDDAGRQAMERIAAYLYENGAEQVKGIDVETQPDGSQTPKGWDLADATGWTPESTWEWAKTRVLTYPNIRSESATAASQPVPVTQDTPKPAPTQPTPAKSKPDLGVVDGNTVRKPRISEIAPEIDLPPEFSEFGMADSFAAQHGEDWRFTAELNRWHYWTGSFWFHDVKCSIIDRISKNINAQRATARLTESQNNRVCTYKTVRNVASLVASKPEIAMLAEQWDANPMELGTPAGVVDLTTGQMREASREAYVSRSTSVAPAPGDTPLFDKVLARASKNDPELTAYLWRWFGYILTGSCREESFLFCHGSAASGKSTMVDVISTIMGTYARSCKPSMFEEAKHEGHPTELADLAGARLAYASESSEGARFHEARIKWLTGGDIITARFMRADNFQFKPTHKIIIHGNHKPSLKSTGEEMRRRIHLVEFPGSIPEDQRDKRLKDKLVAEYPAILHKMILACLEWQRIGLKRPDTVSAATDEYLTGEDTIGAWIDDCIEICDGYKINSSDLYGSFKRWTDKNGEFCPSQKRFSQKLEDRGWTKYRNASGRGFVGMKLKATDITEQYGYY